MKDRNKRARQKAWLEAHGWTEVSPGMYVMTGAWHGPLSIEQEAEKAKQIAKWDAKFEAVRLQGKALQAEQDRQRFQLQKDP